MKKLIIISAVIFIALSCKKTDKEPLGPTDIRVRNLSGRNMTNLTVNTSGGEYNYGNVASSATTEYHRFDKAYTKAQITATIGQDTYSTGTVDYTYLHYLGLMKATYEIVIDNDAQKTLMISNVILDAALK